MAITQLMLAFVESCMQKKRLRSKKQEAEPLFGRGTVVAKDLIGSTNPQALVNPMLLMNGLYLALEVGKRIEA